MSAQRFEQKGRYFCWYGLLQMEQLGLVSIWLFFVASLVPWFWLADFDETFLLIGCFLWSAIFEVL